MSSLLGRLARLFLQPVSQVDDLLPGVADREQESRNVQPGVPMVLPHGKRALILCLGMTLTAGVSVYERHVSIHFLTSKSFH